MDKQAAHREIEAFEARYGYDGTYMHELLEASPGGYERFTAFRPMALYREAAPTEAFYLAKIAAMQHEDCAGCLQLTVRQALEAGVDPAVVRAALDGGGDLEPDLADVYRFAADVAANRPRDTSRDARLRRTLGETAIAELALAIAGARVFPTIKRALGHGGDRCALVTVDLAARP